jgi:tellurite resistance protein TerB
MDAYLTEKLSGEIERYQSKDFLKAAMAVCVLTAYADGHMGLLERSRIDLSLITEPGLKEFDFRKATEILESYAAALTQEGEAAERILRNKVARVAGNHKLARTLMRLSYLIITADRRIEEGEVREFRRLCALLDLEPGQVWEDVELTAD